MVLTKCKFCHTLPEEVSKRNKWVIQSIFINNPPPPHPPLSVSVSLCLSHTLKLTQTMMMMAINCFCKMAESVEPEFRLCWMKLCSSYNQQAQKKNKKTKKNQNKTKQLQQWSTKNEKRRWQKWTIHLMPFKNDNLWNKKVSYNYFYQLYH